MDGKIAIDPMITHTLKLEDINKGFDLMHAGESIRSRRSLLREDRMFSHIMVGSNDIERSKRFYDALFDAIGAKPGRQDEKGVNLPHNGAMFMVRPPLERRSRRRYGNGSTIGFNFDSPERSRTPGTTPASLLAARRSRTRRASAKAASASSTLLICAIPTATSCAGCTDAAE